jgi:hypothetical protein
MATVFALKIDFEICTSKAPMPMEIGTTHLIASVCCDRFLGFRFTGSHVFDKYRHDNAPNTSP